jgi:hypothetical protein
MHVCAFKATPESTKLWAQLAAGVHDLAAAGLVLRWC